jgi:hypothetical protein
MLLSKFKSGMRIALQSPVKLKLQSQFFRFKPRKRQGWLVPTTTLTFLVTRCYNGDDDDDDEDDREDRYVETICKRCEPPKKEERPIVYMEGYVPPSFFFDRQPLNQLVFLGAAHVVSSCLILTGLYHFPAPGRYIIPFNAVPILLGSFFLLVCFDIDRSIVTAYKLHEKRELEKRQ